MDITLSIIIGLILIPLFVNVRIEYSGIHQICYACRGHRSTMEMRGIQNSCHRAGGSTGLLTKRRLAPVYYSNEWYTKVSMTNGRAGL